MDTHFYLNKPTVNINLRNLTEEDIDRLLSILNGKSHPSIIFLVSILESAKNLLEPNPESTPKDRKPIYEN